MMGKGHWYCKQCEDRKEPESVTFEENCADCGANVVFIETIRGILFSRIQGDYYELTGEKPLLCLKADGDIVYPPNIDFRCPDGSFMAKYTGKPIKSPRGILDFKGCKKITIPHGIAIEIFETIDNLAKKMGWPRLVSNETKDDGVKNE